MTDLAALARRQYATLDPLTVRIRTHELHTAYPDDIEANVSRAVELTSTDDLLDVGCGTGAYLRRLATDGHLGQLTGLDMSAAAVAALQQTPGVTAMEGDAQQLPFPAASFDVVTARHMLYHVPEPLTAVREARRVLRPGGRFAGLVNIERTTPMLMGLLADTLAEHGLRRPRPAGEVGRGPRVMSVHDRNLPAMVEQVFGHAEVRRHDNELVFDAPEPVIAYAMSCLIGWGVPEEHPLRAAVIDSLVARAEAMFAGGRQVRDPKGYVIVTASA
jgi:ubiquinone/menaquinone biosynthesis C-methylase UbiE